MSAVAAPNSVNELPAGEFAKKPPWWPHPHPAKPTPILQHDYRDQNAEFTLKFDHEVWIVLQVVAASDSDPQGDTGARDQAIVYFDGNPMTPTDNLQWDPKFPNHYEFSVVVPNQNVPWRIPANTPLAVKIVHDNRRAKSRKLDVTVLEVKHP